MISSRTYLLFAIFAFASLALTVNADCVRNIDGQIFNLCSFQDPLNYFLDLKPGWMKMVFSLNQPNVPPCKNSTANSWFSLTVSSGFCQAQIKTDPIFSYTEKSSTRDSALRVNYHSDTANGTVALMLICNQTAPHDAHVDLFAAGMIDDGILVAGYSYYGCSVKADSKDFLSF